MIFKSRKGEDMASSDEFVQYVVEQLDKAGPVVAKKLFGEYGLWLHGKFFGTVEDNQFYIKATKAGKMLMPGAVLTAPHGGVPGSYAVEALEDRDFLRELVLATWEELPAPRAGKKKR